MILKCTNGSELWVPREEAQELGEDEYYVADLIGMDVVLERWGVISERCKT